MNAITDITKDELDVTLSFFEIGGYATQAQLESAIATEKSRAEGVESTIASSVNAEASARINADDNLQGQITTNASNIVANTENISNEVTSRTNEVSRLDTRVDSANATAKKYTDAETSARETAINQVYDYVNAKISATYHYKGSVATEDKLPTSGNEVGDTYNIVAKSSWGVAGTNVSWTGTGWDALGGAIDVDTINANIAKNASDIANESITRKANDDTLQSNIDAEKNRAALAESTNASAIAAEQTARIANDNTLQSNIDANSTKIDNWIADYPISYSDTSGFWIWVVRDKNGKVVYGQRKDGTMYNFKDEA